LEKAFRDRSNGRAARDGLPSEMIALLGGRIA